MSVAENLGNYFPSRSGVREMILTAFCWSGNLAACWTWILDSVATDGSTEVDGNQDDCEVTFAAAGGLFYFLGAVSSQLCKTVSSQLCPVPDFEPNALLEQ